MAAIAFLAATTALHDDWLECYEEALRQARSSGRPILVYVFDSG